MKHRKKKSPGAYLKKRKVKKYQEGGKQPGVKDLLSYLEGFDPSRRMQVPTSDAFDIPVAQVNIPAAEVVTEGTETLVNAMLPERLAKTEGDLAAVYKQLGSEGVDKYLDMTQGVADAQNEAFEAIRPFLYLTPMGTPAFLSDITQHPERYNPQSPEGALNLAGALATFGRARAPQPVTIAERYAMQGLKDKVREKFRQIFPRKPEVVPDYRVPQGPPSQSGMFNAMGQAAVEAELIGGEASVLGQRGLPSGASVARRGGPKGPGAEGVDPVQPRPDTVYGTHGKNLRDGNEPAWRILRNQPNVSAAQLQADYDPDILPEDVDAAAVVRYNEAQEYQRNIIMAHSDVYGGGYNRSNVSQLPVLMHGSKLENAIDKNGYISVSQLQQLIDKGQMSQPESEALQSALETAILNEKAKVVTEQIGAEAFAEAEEGPSAFFERKKLLDAVDVKKVSWNDLKRLAVRSGSPYEIVQHPVGQRSDGSVRANKYQTMGIDRLYENAEEGSAVYQLDPINQTARTTTITTSNPILKNVGMDHFGANVLAHYRSFRRPDQPDILYITEVQADPLQARPEEFPDYLGSGKTQVTRQVGLPGARRYNDRFRTFQVIAAENVDYSLGQIQKDFLKIFDILKNPGDAARLSAIRTLQSQILAYGDSFDSFDNAMLAQMINDPSLSKPWYTGQGSDVRRPMSIDLFDNRRRSESTDVKRMVSGIMYEIETLIEKVDESPRWQAHFSGERPVTDNPEWVKGFEKLNDQIAEKVDLAREILNGVGDNVYHYRAALQEGYNGKLTPLQAKLVKNQDQFVVGKILEAESSGALHIRFPKGETAGKIQGYETLEDQVAMVQMSINENLNGIKESKSDLIRTHGSEVFQWAPRSQGKSLENMSDEEFLAWWNGAQNNEPAYKEIKGQARTIATREVERKMIAVKRQLRDMGINPRRHGELDNISDMELHQIFYDNNLVVGKRYNPDSPVYRQLVEQGITGDAIDVVIRERAERIESAWEDLAIQITDVNTERAHLQSIQQGDNYDAHQAIMDGYDALTKAFKKHKLTYREVTDEFGNAWYEVDVPANLNMNSGEVRSYKRGGRVGMKVKKKAPFKLIKR